MRQEEPVDQTDALAAQEEPVDQMDAQDSAANLDPDALQLAVNLDPDVHRWAAIPGQVHPEVARLDEWEDPVAEAYQFQVAKAKCLRAATESVAQDERRSAATLDQAVQVQVARNRDRQEADNLAIPGQDVRRDD